MDAVYEGTFERDGITRVVESVAPAANGVVHVGFNEWRDGDGFASPTRGTATDIEWRRWVAWANRLDEAPRPPPPTFVDCPSCAFRLVKEPDGFGPGDELGCSKCKQVFTVRVEAVAVGVKK
jgi:hypothetical protein